MSGRAYRAHALAELSNSATFDHKCAPLHQAPCIWSTSSLLVAGYCTSQQEFGWTFSSPHMTAVHHAGTIGLSCAKPAWKLRHWSHLTRRKTALHQQVQLSFPYALQQHQKQIYCVHLKASPLH